MADEVEGGDAAAVEGVVVCNPRGGDKAADFADFAFTTLLPQAAAVRGAWHRLDKEAESWRQQVAALQALVGAAGREASHSVRLLVDVGAGYLMQGEADSEAAESGIVLDVGGGVMPQLSLVEAIGVCQRRLALAERLRDAAREQLVKITTDVSIAKALVTASLTTGPV
jgi:prefoldin subunit 5